MGTEQDPGKLEDPNMITIQQSGNNRHHDLQYACQDAANYSVPIVWLDPEEEVKRAQAIGINTIIKRRDGYELLCYNSDYNLNFKCDGIIMYKNIRMILEIKTEALNKWEARVAAEPKHKFQAYAYALCLGIYNVMFLYEDRNFTRRKAYHINITEQELAPIKERVEIVMGYKNKNEVPPKEKDKCIYCK
jgi:CRISPR/Cas system-associated exonuclease Cas4 (RecB family)